MEGHHSFLSGAKIHDSDEACRGQDRVDGICENVDIGIVYGVLDRDEERCA